MDLETSKASETNKAPTDVQVFKPYIELKPKNKLHLRNTISEYKKWVNLSEDWYDSGNFGKASCKVLWNVFALVT